MLKITALNEESDDESEPEKEGLTREALEEIALQQYAKTLELQKKGNLKDALKLLKDLLTTELLYEVEKPEEKDNISRPLLNLKYLCFRNIASLSTQLEDYEGAIEAYLNASELDDTDVTLWYRLGKTSLHCKKYELASFAFQRGVDCNTTHWPCLDNLITVLLGLENYNDCILYIYKALELDSDYLRGRVYRKYIFSNFSYIQQYLALINPIYLWKPDDDKDICGENCDKLLKEATDINEIHIKYITKDSNVERLPVLSLNKPIENLSWLSLGESLTDMHIHLSQVSISHACIIEIYQPIQKLEDVPDNVFSSISEEKAKDSISENTILENKVESEKNEELKTSSETEKEQNDQETTQIQDSNKSGNESKDVKKGPTRRRGSSLSFLEQWEWCTKRRSSRKKTVNRQDRNDESIYDTLKRIMPQYLMANENKQKKAKELVTDDSMDTMDIYKLFEEKEKTALGTTTSNEKLSKDETLYFGTDDEKKDVENFINKFMQSKCDIISMLDEYVLILSSHWQKQWPEGLGNIFIVANKCSKQHYDPPLGCDNSDNKINRFIYINLVHLEIEVGKLLQSKSNQTDAVDIELIDTIKFLCLKFEGAVKEYIDVILRYLWVKCHANLYEDKTEFALDCLYHMMYELNCLEDNGEEYSLYIPNFFTKPAISKNTVKELLKSLERNKQLSTVLTLYDMEKYEEILPILQDSFKYCQTQANKQEWSEVGLDWALHMVILLETLWALKNIQHCFTWAVICLHEGLKHYLICTPGSTDYEKWTLTMVKILMTIEHILKKEGSFFLDVLPEKAFTHLIQDVIQIIIHQLDELNNTEDMPLKTVVPWIVLHYILQREEDCGRVTKKTEDDVEREDLPPSLFILFTGHNYLGKKGWCMVNEGYLLHFILNTVLPRLRSPALSSVVENVSQCLEQVVFCLFGHPSKKTKTRYLSDHNAVPSKLDWELAQKIFELYRPYEMPEFNSYRVGSITSETEQLFQRMLALLPSMYDPQPYVNDVISFIERRKEMLPDADLNFPYKVRDIYYLLADYYLKNNETIKALRYYAYDIVISKNRFDSWAGIALARASLLETKLNSCETFRTEMEYLDRAAAVERCFKRALDIDSSHSMLWIEYGAFVYGVHSFCSRMLKQASESLSMENFEILEKRKDDMLNTAQNCFVSAHKKWMVEFESDDKALQDERWLHYYMLGKISEKKGDKPTIYLDHYAKAAQFLLDNNASYPSKINYNNPQNLSVEALEIHYRIHASILKYIEQHENKAIFMSDGKAFQNCLSNCACGPFSKKKVSKETSFDKETHMEVLSNENNSISKNDKGLPESENEKNVNFKRSSDNNDCEINSKKLKFTETNLVEKTTEIEKNYTENSVSDILLQNFDRKDIVRGDMMETAGEVVVCTEKDSNDTTENNMMDINGSVTVNDQLQNNEMYSTDIQQQFSTSVKEIYQDSEANINKNGDNSLQIETNKKNVITSETRRISQESTTTNTLTSKEDSSSDSSSSSSSDDSTSDSSSDTSNESISKVENKDDVTEMPNEEISNIISSCLDNLEECVSRFPQHYKALYRLAHYHFYYKKDKNLERCRDLMLNSFQSRNNNRVQGLFSERKNSNFFNGIWRIPASEVDRPGSFASHMSRCVLITMEILKESDDHKTLLDLSIQLQRTPEAEKKYLRDAERGELSQQAFSLCVQSIKGLFSKFSHLTHSSLCINDSKTISNFMVDVYKSYQKVQKHMPMKNQAFSSLLIDCYKLLTGNSNENNVLELSIKYCQSIISMMKQQSNANANSSQSSSQTNSQLKKPIKNVDNNKPAIPTVSTNTFLPTLDLKQSFAKNMFTQSIPNPLMPYMVNPQMDPLINALSYVSNIENLVKYVNIPGSASFRSDIMQQIITQSLNNSFSQQLKPNNPTTITKLKTRDNMKITKPSNARSVYSKKQNIIYGLNSPLSKTKPMVQKVVPAFQNVTVTQVTPGSSKNTSSDILKNVPTLPNSFSNHTSTSLFGSGVNNIQVKPAYPTTSQISNCSGQIKNMNLLTSTIMTSGYTKPIYMTSQTNTNCSGQIKSTHIANKTSANTSGQMKPAHVTISPAITTCSGLAKPAHLTNTHIITSCSGQVKPAHMTTTSTVGAALLTKPPLPHQQISPGKTLQEKLAERQKQNPNNSKVQVNKPVSARSIACAAFSGKIPPSLTITKSSTSGKTPITITSNIHQEQRHIAEGVLRKVNDTKRNISFESPDSKNKTKNIVDTSEVIILDDDD